MKSKLGYILAMITALALAFLMGWFFKPEGLHVDLKPLPASTSETEEVWTCSMHPQIRANEPGACPICGMDLIPADGGAQSSNPLAMEMTADAVKLANIQTTVVGSENAGSERELKLNGKVKADETQAASIVTHLPGRIEKLYVSFTGEEIRRGQKIASIYSPDLITAQKELIEVKKIADLSPALLEAAKNKLRFWKISNEAIEKILQSGEVKETFDIHSDHAGIVTNRRVSVGDHIAAGTVLFDVVNLDRIWVLFDTYEEDLTNIKVGNEIVFRTPSLPGKSFVSKVTFIDPVINANTRVATIRTELPNNSHQLKPEMFVKGMLTSSSKSGQKVSVPKSAVLWTGERSVVYVKIPDAQLPSFE